MKKKFITDYYMIKKVYESDTNRPESSIIGAMFNRYRRIYLQYFIN